MSNLIVVDVGNSRMKWGRCDDHKVLDGVSLPLEDTERWTDQFQTWPTEAPLRWAVAGVNPDGVERLLSWLKSRADDVQVLDSYQMLPLRLSIENPEQVGIDRLLNAVAAISRAPNRPAILVDAGSAVTVDWVDETQAFRGGAIFPGLRLMARALRDYTAKLPLVETGPDVPVMPGTSTSKAIAAGIHGAVVGGIEHLVKKLTMASQLRPIIYLTGGDARLLAPALETPLELWPHMTLEGTRLSATRMP